MQKFSTAVPFDPGYSSISFHFLDDIDALIQDYTKFKSNHQKKFWLATGETKILDLIEKSTAFYLGCLLWGSFINLRFKDAPKPVEGSNIPNMSEEEFKEFDCAYEVNVILECIKFLDRDCKYFLNRPLKVKPIIVEILNEYADFAKINNNFRDIKITDDVKLPKFSQRFAKYSNSQLDELCDGIYSVIKNGKIEKLYELI